MTKIYGSAENYMLATGITYNSFFPATLSASGDSGLTKAVQDWQTRMKETAYPSFSNPQQASDAGKAAGGQEETRIAVTDATCRDHTGFHAAIDKVLDRYVTTRMRELTPQIEQVTHIRKTAAANASGLHSSADKVAAAHKLQRQPVGRDCPINGVWVRPVFISWWFFRTGRRR